MHLILSVIYLNEVNGMESIDAIFALLDDYVQALHVIRSPILLNMFKYTRKCI